MSDIIANAQRLLDGATPAPWEWVGYSLEAEHGMVLDFQCVTAFGQSGALREVEATPEDEQIIAAAPGLAQALAEETWEYSYQIKYADGWETACDDVSHVDKWWPDRSVAEDAANSAYDPYVNRPMRLVCRRVSPPEVLPNTTINPAAAP